ncbi:MULTISPECIES: energy transducer TonB [Kordiimonas]|jgi:TonB family protein|uniref:energy transducer TonB n=1 Tax=Kordiimonas TaxID=288021 RepID=UPI00257CAE03|nr:energy transducer TonB [Kordiimonas sp. UBA4487]
MKLIGTSLIALGVTVVILGIVTYLAYMKPFTIPSPSPFPHLNYVMITDDGWDGGYVREDRTVCCCFWPEPNILGRSFNDADFRNARATVMSVGTRPDKAKPIDIVLNDLLASHIEPTVIDITYPRLAMTQGHEGDVLVQVRLSPDGTVADVAIIRSGVNRQLDLAAIKAVMEARFDAPIRDGQQVRPMTRRFLIKFRLPAAA